MIFAAKTTTSGLIALLIAFTFNLDQPQWALLTVFIVSQAQQSGLVLAKSFYRIIGTLVGASVALLFVAAFAQERVLFLGALALWIGLCTFGSQYARNFAAYAFVLAGYTAAIVGVPGALDANNAFYMATARVTEICLGIIVAAAINRIVLPSSTTAALWQSVVAARQALVDHVTAVLRGDDAVKSTASLVSTIIAIENQRASAIFEDRDLCRRSNSIRLLNIALLKVVGATQAVSEQLGYFRHTGRPVGARVDDVVAAVISVLTLWRSGAIGAAGLPFKLHETDARQYLIQRLFLAPLHDDAARCRAITVSAVRELFVAVTAYAEAYEGCISNAPPVRDHVSFTRANDLMTALWTGSRAALAVGFVGYFWIVTAWPHGPTAVILAAVATARSGDNGTRRAARGGCDDDLRAGDGTHLHHRRCIAAICLRLPDVRADSRADAVRLRFSDVQTEPEGDVDRLHVRVALRIGRAVPEPYGLRPSRPAQHLDRRSHRGWC